MISVTFTYHFCAFFLHFLVSPHADLAEYLPALGNRLNILIFNLL